MKKKSAIIIAIILMSIGFASISTTLIINGNANVSENNEDFSVIFTAASIEGQDVYTTAVDDTKKIITFETSELKTLNQTSILTYEVTNNSSNYDANATVTCVPKEGSTAKYTSIKNKLENDATKVLAKSSVNGTIYNALPSELQNVISSTKVISGHGNTSGETNFETQDKLYLLSAHEVYENGKSNLISESREDAAYSNTKQLDYYKNQGVTTNNYAGAKKQYNGSNSDWWLRSATARNTASFLCVWYSGNWGGNTAISSYGVSPAFRIA